MKSLLHAFIDTDKRIFFVFLCVTAFLLLFIKKEFIESEIAAFEILQERGEMELFNRLSTLQYIGIPVIYLFKITITAFVIWVGCFMFGYRVTFTQLWGAAAVGESIFLIPEFLKIGYFFSFVGDPTYFELSSYYPFSLLQLFDHSAVSDRWVYPLKALNLFEIGYWFILVHAVHYISRKRLKIAYYIIFTSYVIFFFLWLGFYLLIYK